MATLAARASHFRGALDPSAPAVAAPWFKEWVHFCVFGPGVDLLVNLSLMGPGAAERADRRDARREDGPELPGRARPGALKSRSTVLARTAGGAWTGSVEDIPDAGLVFSPGRVDALFGETALRSRAGAFELHLRPRDIPVSARLRLEPGTMPLVRPRTEIGEARVSWLAIPRLRAFGTVTVDGKTTVLRGVPAYHDHNWGSWRWGRDFFWQWACGLPARDDDPWTFVFYRLFDRARTIDHALAMLVWRGPELYRVFHAGDIAVEQEGFLRSERVTKVPAVMALLVPRLTTDVPRRLVATARAGRDEVRFEIESRDLAQVLVPNESDLETTIINEVAGEFRARGTIRGVDVNSSGSSFHEHVTST